MSDTNKIVYERPAKEIPEVDSVIRLKIFSVKFTECLVYYNILKKQVAYETAYKNGIGVHYNYWRNGKLKKVDSVQYDANNEFYSALSSIYYCENGQVAVRYSSTAIENGVFKQWYCNGKIKMITGFKNYEAVSDTHFDENGFKTKEYIYYKGLYDYKVIFYDEKGNVSKTESWKEGKMIGD